MITVWLLDGDSPRAGGTLFWDLVLTDEAGAVL